MDSFEKHKMLAKKFVQHTYKGTTDAQVLARNHKFVRDEAADASSESWEVRMALKYYQRLSKEYCICDLSRHREGAIGLRWRTEREVLSGKGQFECGALRCDTREGLHSYEVNFAYEESGATRNELVKCRLCGPCAEKLYYRKLKELRKERQRERKRRERAAAASTASGDSTGGASPVALTGHALVQDAIASSAQAASAAAAAAAAAAAVEHKGKRRREPDSSSSSSRRSKKAAAAADDSSTADVDSTSGIVEADAGELWSRPVEVARTAGNEMDDYLNGLFM
jgi:Folate-sensitive fragile site protein Fra10Ac1